MYIGEPSSGKTGLTKPLLALFGTYAFLKPQVGTSFALQGLIGAKAVIWNDFRWPHPPLAWGDLLNMLDNEPFNVGVPKVDGQEDHRWNPHGDANVIAVLTSNVPVAYVKDNSVNQLETKAWDERFGMVLHFKHALPNPDKRYKKWFMMGALLKIGVERNRGDTLHKAPQLSIGMAKFVIHVVSELRCFVQCFSRRLQQPSFRMPQKVSVHSLLCSLDSPSDGTSRETCVHAFKAS